MDRPGVVCRWVPDSTAAAHRGEEGPQFAKTDKPQHFSHFITRKAGILPQTGVDRKDATKKQAKLRSGSLFHFPPNLPQLEPKSRHLGSGGKPLFGGPANRFKAVALNPLGSPMGSNKHMSLYPLGGGGLAGPTYPMAQHPPQCPRLQGAAGRSGAAWRTCQAADGGHGVE